LFLTDLRRSSDLLEFIRVAAKSSLFPFSSPVRVVISDPAHTEEAKKAVLEAQREKNIRVFFIVEGNEAVTNPTTALEKLANPEPVELNESGRIQKIINLPEPLTWSGITRLVDALKIFYSNAIN
jgi:hypothetical protein